MLQNCLVCGSDKYLIEQSSKICLECGFQTVYFQLLEKGDEYEDCSHSNNKKIKEDISEWDFQIPKDDYEMTFSTYEAFNIILRKWTSALQHMGASNKFREAVFSLWFLYLQKRKVAFLKDFKDEADLIAPCPKGYSCLQERDIKFIKKKELSNSTKKRKTSKAFSKEEKSKRKIVRQSLSGNVSQHTLASEMSLFLNEAEVKTDPETEDESFENDGLLQDDLFIKENDINESNAGVEQDSPYSDNSECEEEYLAKYSRALIISPYHLTLDKLLGFLYLGILIAREDLLLIDLIRLCREGFIPYNCASYLLEKNMKIDKKDKWLLRIPIPSYKRMRQHVAVMSCFLSLQALPLPPYELVIDKFIKALGLPTDIKLNVFTILYKLGAVAHSELATPPIELYVASAILLLFKIYWGMDDCQEEILSCVADKLNYKLQDEQSDYRLFSWSRWQMYINSVMWLCKEVNPSDILYSDSHSCNDKKISKDFWSNTIWNFPRISQSPNEEMKAKWNICFETLQMKGSTIEEVMNEERITAPYKTPLLGVVEQYIQSEYQKDPSRDRDRLLKIAKQLVKSPFSKTKFDWPYNTNNVVEELLHAGVHIKFEKHSTPINLGTCRNSISNSVENISIPNTQECFWLIESKGKNALMPKSFFSVLKLFEKICCCTSNDLINTLVTLERKYELRSRKKC